MRILGLDTTGAYCSAALVDTAKVLAYKSENIGRGHAERLAPMVQEVLAEARLTAKDVDKIAVCTGPGSFTGLRVALAFAKAFALPRKLAVVGIDALGISHMQHFPDGAPNTVQYKDIRRNEVMYGAYAGAGPLFVGFPKSGSIEEAKAEADFYQFDLLEVSHIDTRVLAWLGAELSPADYPAAPLYSRGPDAKLPGGLDPK